MAIKLPPPDAQPNATPRAASHTETSQRSEAEPTVVEPAPAAKTKPGWLSRTARTLASQPVKVLGGEVELSGMGIDLRFRGQVTHQVALSKDSELVTSNEDRAAAAENGTTWTRVGAVGGVDASVVGLGYNKTLKVAAVVPTASKVSAESLVKLPRDQASLITLEFHPDSISKLLPGSEFTLSSSDLKTVGVRKGAGVSAFGLNAAVEVGFDASSKESGYEKSVVVGQDGVIGFRIDRADTTRRSVGAGVGVGFGVIDGDGAEMVGDFSNERNHVNLFSAYAGASDRTTRSLKVTAQPDITTKIGFDGYRALMKLDPTAFETSPEGARKAIEASGMSVAYFDQTRDRGLGARVSVGSFNAFNIGSTSRASDGVLLEVKSEAGQVLQSTKLSEREYTRTATGALPRWTKGEEREAMVRMGTVSVDGGPETRAALFSLKVADAEVTAAENVEMARFAGKLGFTSSTPATGTKGKGQLSVKLGLTDENIAKLDTLTPEQFRRAFEQEIEAVKGPLPWNNEALSKRGYLAERDLPPMSIKARFEEATADLARVSGDSDRAQREFQSVTHYRNTTGGDYYTDLDAKKSVELLTRGFEEARGKSLHQRGPMLETLSKLSATELRAALVLLKTEAGAGVVDFQYSGNGVHISAQAREAAKSSDEIAEEALSRRPAKDE